MNAFTGDDPYKAPASNTSLAPTDDLMAAYIGPKNSEYYLRRFDRFLSMGSRMSWHWPAFFVASLWLLYRKMWLLALAYWVGLPALCLLVALFFGGAGSVNRTYAWYNILYYGTTFLLVPLFANWAYFRHTQKKVARVSATHTDTAERAAELARIGGTSKIIYVLAPFLVVMLIGILAAIAIPAYQDYTIRAQVSEGLSLAARAQRAVAEYHEREGEFPADNEAAGLPDARELSGAFVAGVSIEGGDIRVLYGNGANSLLGGSSLSLQARVREDGDLDWHCIGMGIEAKHLPGACRP